MFFRQRSGYKKEGEWDIPGRNIQRFWVVVVSVNRNEGGSGARARGVVSG